MKFNIIHRSWEKILKEWRRFIPQAAQLSTKLEEADPCATGIS